MTHVKPVIPIKTVAQRHLDSLRAFVRHAVITMSAQSSLGQRLQALQSQARNIEAAGDLGKLSMAELEQLTVQFGEKHRNKTYQQVWKEDPQWLQFVASRYENSPKPAHVSLIYFIHLKVERAELTGQENGSERIPTYAKAPSKAAPVGAQSKAKAKAKMMTKPHNTEEGSVPSDGDLSDLEIVEEQYTPRESTQMSQIQERMERLEDVLNQVISHLSKNDQQ